MAASKDGHSQELHEITQTLVTGMHWSQLPAKSYQLLLDLWVCATAR